MLFILHCKQDTNVCVFYVGCHFLCSQSFRARQNPGQIMWSLAGNTTRWTRQPVNRPATSALPTLKLFIKKTARRPRLHYFVAQNQQENNLKTLVLVQHIPEKFIVLSPLSSEAVSRRLRLR